MKSIHLLVPFVFLLLVGCTSGYNWKNVRPMQERLINLELKTGYFHGRSDIHVSSYVIPDKNDTPEVRVVIVGNFKVNDPEEMKKLVTEVEEVVKGVMPYASDIPRDTSRIKIQLTGYDSTRKVMEYSRYKWTVLQKTVTDSELREEARKLQLKLAEQRGLE